jgi:hypothetical protein
MQKPARWMCRLRRTFDERWHWVMDAYDGNMTRLVDMRSARDFATREQCLAHAKKTALRIGLQPDREILGELK